MNQALFLLSKSKSNKLLILDFIENVIQLNIGDMGYPWVGFKKSVKKNQNV